MATLKMVVKLSEAAFRPMYFKVMNMSITAITVDSNFGVDSSKLFYTCLIVFIKYNIIIMVAHQRKGQICK